MSIRIRTVHQPTGLRAVVLNNSGVAEPLCLGPWSQGQRRECSGLQRAQRPHLQASELVAFSKIAPEGEGGGTCDWPADVHSPCPYINPRFIQAHYPASYAKRLPHLTDFCQKDASRCKTCCVGLLTPFFSSLLSGKADMTATPQASWDHRPSAKGGTAA